MIPQDAIWIQPGTGTATGVPGSEADPFYNSEYATFIPLAQATDSKSIAAITGTYNPKLYVNTLDGITIYSADGYRQAIITDSSARMAMASANTVTLVDCEVFSGDHFIYNLLLADFRLEHCYLVVSGKAAHAFRELRNCLVVSGAVASTSGLLNVVIATTMRLYNTTFYEDSPSNPYMVGGNGITLMEQCVILSKFGMPALSQGGIVDGSSNFALTNIGGSYSEVTSTDVLAIDAENGNFELLPTSPAISAGASAIVGDYYLDLSASENVANDGSQGSPWARLREVGNDGAGGVHTMVDGDVILITRTSEGESLGGSILECRTPLTADLVFKPEDGRYLETVGGFAWTLGSTSIAGKKLTVEDIGFDKVLQNYRAFDLGNDTASANPHRLTLNRCKFLMNSNSVNWCVSFHLGDKPNNHLEMNSCSVYYTGPGSTNSTVTAATDCYNRRINGLSIYTDQVSAATNMLGGWSNSVTLPGSYLKNVTIKSKNSLGIKLFTGAGTNAEFGNIVYENVDTPAAGNPVNADPLFVDPANGNFELLPTSPAISAGGADVDPVGTIYVDPNAGNNTNDGLTIGSPKLSLGDGGGDGAETAAGLGGSSSFYISFLNHDFGGQVTFKGGGYTYDFSRASDEYVYTTNFVVTGNCTFKSFKYNRAPATNTICSLTGSVDASEVTFEDCSFKHFSTGSDQRHFNSSGNVPVTWKGCSFSFGFGSGALLSAAFDSNAKATFVGCTFLGISNPDFPLNQSVPRIPTSTNSPNIEYIACIFKNGNTTHDLTIGINLDHNPAGSIATSDCSTIDTRITQISPDAPLFIDADNGNFELLPTSPAIG